MHEEKRFAVGIFAGRVVSSAAVSVCDGLFRIINLRSFVCDKKFNITCRFRFIVKEFPFKKDCITKRGYPPGGIMPLFQLFPYLFVVISRFQKILNNF